MFLLGSSKISFLPLHFSVVKTKAGSTTRLANIAKVKVTDTYTTEFVKDLKVLP